MLHNVNPNIIWKNFKKITYRPNLLAAPAPPKEPTAPPTKNIETIEAHSKSKPELLILAS